MDKQIKELTTLVLELKSLVLEQNTRIDDITALFGTLELSKPIPRSRTITPISDDERCTKTLVSGKNKGSKCSKKATVGSLCTIHNKKYAISSELSDEFVPEYILSEERNQ
jgi:hypothetical protein